MEEIEMARARSDADPASTEGAAARAAAAGLETAKTDTQREKALLKEGDGKPFSEGTQSNPGPVAIVYAGGDPGTPGDDIDASNPKLMNAASGVTPDGFTPVVPEPVLISEASQAESHSANRRGAEQQTPDKKPDQDPGWSLSSRRDAEAAGRKKSPSSGSKLSKGANPAKK